jgi:hypothetical protein
MEIIGQTHVYHEVPNKIKEPEYVKWEGFAKEQRAKAPEGMKYLFQTTKIVWAIMPTESQFITQATSGIILTMIFVFIVLLISTQNVI